MGCFNVKCSISGLPISSGNPCVLLIGYVPALNERPANGGGAYPKNMFRHLTIPIRGIYNDYGWIEDANQDQLDAAHLMLKLSRNDQYIGNISVDGYWNDSILKDISFEILFRRSIDRNYCISYIHGDMYDALIESNQTRRVDDWHTKSINSISDLFEQDVANGLVECQRPEHEQPVTYPVNPSLTKLFEWYDLGYPDSVQNRYTSAAKLDEMRTALQNPEILKGLRDSYILHNMLVETSIGFRPSVSDTVTSQGSVIWGQAVLIETMKAVLLKEVSDTSDKTFDEFCHSEKQPHEDF